MGIQGNMLWIGLIKMQRLILVISVCISITAVFAEVILRYCFNSSFVGIEELAAYCAFWMYFIGASYGAYERSHIKAELTHLIFGNTMNYARCRALTSFISFAAATYVIPWAYDYVVWGFERGEQSRSTLLGSTYPVVYFQISILIGLCLMAFYFLIESIQWVRIIRENDRRSGGGGSHRLLRFWRYLRCCSVFGYSHRHDYDTPDGKTWVSTGVLCCAYQFRGGA
ncbi:MAG: TRAP transporter small permease [Desulfobulbaceae bacterium]|nr:TRAP transporter small permease [Desulfobulbaceae bacterium]